MRKAAAIRRTNGLRRAKGGILMTWAFRLPGRLAIAGGVTAAVLSPSVAHAEKGTAVLVGTVTDASTKKPIPDVVVTVASPSLQGDEVTVTDSSGFYRVANLPPGEYVLRLEKEAFRAYTSADIGLHADTTIRLNAAILPEALKAEEVVVVGKAPTVDVGSSTTGATITSEFTSRVPVSPPGAKGSFNQSFESVADVVPGARSDVYGMSFTGTTSPENSYLLDGISVNNPAYGLIGTPLSMNFIKEVSVISGGFMPEYGRSTGGVLNAITKSGSNEFHGSVFSNYAPGSLSGRPKPVISAGQTIESGRHLDFQGDVGGDVGGPIVKDKLWFYAGFDWARNQYDLTRSLNRTVLDAMGNPVSNNHNGFQTVPIPGTQQGFVARADLYQVIGKLTWQANKTNRFELSGYATPYSSGGNGRYGINPINGLPEIGTGATGNVYEQQLWGTYGALAHEYLGSSGNALLKWSTQLDGETARLDTTLGWHHETGGRLPSDGTPIGSQSGLGGIANAQYVRTLPNEHNITDFESVPNGACTPNAAQLAANPLANPCPVSIYHQGGPESVDDQVLNTYQAHTVLTILAQGAGHHVIKAGAEAELATYGHDKAYTGERDYTEYPPGNLGFYVDGRQFGYLTGPDKPVILPSLSNQTKSLTVGGFIQDSWSVLDLVTLNLGVRYDVQQLYSGDGEVAMSLPNEWSPRAGAVWDPSRDGRAKIFANYARYYEGVPLDMMDREGTGEPELQAGHAVSTCNPGDPAMQKTNCHVPLQGLAGYPPNSAYNVTQAGKTPVDPDIVAPSDDEFVFGGEYEVIHDGRLGAVYTKRWLNNTIEDMSRDEGQTLFFGNPGEGIAKDFPKATRNYDAVTVYFNKFFSDDWLAQASYTASYLRGNYPGLFLSTNGQLDPNQTALFDLKELTINTNGPLPNDHRHSIKLFGAKDFILPGNGDLTTGLALRAESGAPTSYLGAHPIYGQDSVYILPQGAGERLPWNYSADVKLAYGLRLTKSQTVSFTVDIFNLFNFQGVATVDQTYTTSVVSSVTNGGVGNLKNADGSTFVAAEKNPNFGNPAAYQAPRIFRFGLKATF